MPNSKKSSSIKQTNVVLDQATSTQRDVMIDLAYDFDCHLANVGSGVLVTDHVV